MKTDILKTQNPEILSGVIRRAAAYAPGEVSGFFFLERR
jgi:hypothetical protein